jgi:hypothetical protein
MKIAELLLRSLRLSESSRLAQTSSYFTLQRLFIFIMLKALHTRVVEIKWKKKSFKAKSININLRSTHKNAFQSIELFICVIKINLYSLSSARLLFTEHYLQHNKMRSYIRNTLKKYCLRK